MKKRFKVIIERKGEDYVARCPDVPSVEGRGRDKSEALEKIRASITRKLGDDPDAGSAPFLHPVSPPPPGPIIVEESHEKPND